MITDFEANDATHLNQVRSGTVVDRRGTSSGPQVKVVYPDRDGVTSDWLPVGQAGSAGTGFHYCPRVGDNVTVAHFPTGIEQGMVIGTNPTPNNPAFKPRSLNAVAMQTDDGAYFEHDPDAGCLSLAGIATLYLQSKGELSAAIGTTVTLTSGGTITVTAGGTVKNTAPKIKFNGVLNDSSGNVTIPGTLTVQQNVQFNATGSIATHLANNDGAGGGS